MSVEHIFKLGDITIAQREEITRLRVSNKALVETLERIADVANSHQDDSTRFWRCIDIARAAIAAAKGEK